MRKLLLLLVIALPLSAQTITLLHLSDYHSHALPFYTDEGERGGIARAIGYLRAQKRAGALVFSGGDTINKGAPVWSDKYGCVEWPWFNGIVDAMAFGNHDADYGREAFDRCRASVTYPILSANTEGFRGHAVFTVRGVRIGVFALAGADFPHLVKVPGFTFSSPVPAAREMVRKLREEEQADLVVMIGHQGVDDDYSMAKSFPGIDLIFGSHSHLQRALTLVPGTSTAYISPSQYLTYVSRVEIQMKDGRVASMRGELIPIDHSIREDRRIARRVAKMQRDLAGDPQYSALFRIITTLDAPISTAALGQRTVDMMRDLAKADVALSTKSTFRAPLPAGDLTMETLLNAMPYENYIVACTMSGAKLRRLLDAAGEEAFISGPSSIDETRSYRVAATDFVASIAHREEFDCEHTNTGLLVREELYKTLKGR